MEKEKKQLGVAFIVVLVAIVMVSAIGIIAMSNKPVVLQEIGRASCRERVYVLV